MHSNASVSGEVTFSSNVAVGESSCGGGMYVYDSCVNVTESVVLVDNHADLSGGGIQTLTARMDIAGSVSVNKTSAGQYGGGIAMATSNLSVSGSLLLADNSASAGGGLIIQQDSNIAITGTLLLTSNSAGSFGGGMLVYGSCVNVTDSVVLIDNHAGFSGGGLQFFTGCMDIAGSVSVTNSSAGLYGGGIAMTTSNLSVSGSLLLTGNSAGTGGGLIIQQDSNMDIAGTLLLTNNSAGSLGGGMYVDGSSMNVTDSVVLIDNHAGLSGGGLQSLTAHINIAGSVSISKSSAGKYGGVAMATSNLSVSGSLLLTGNSGDQGGGLNIQQDSNMDITGTLLLTNNSAHSLGGGMYVDSSCVNVTNSVVLSDNHAGLSGGGIQLITGCMDVAGTVSVTNSSAGQYGGGIAMVTSNLSVSGSLLLADNSGHGGQGGGLNIQQDSSMDITGNMLVTNNSAGEGGGVYVLGSCLNVTDSVVLIDNHASSSGGGLQLVTGCMDIAGTVSITKNSAGRYGGGIEMATSNLSVSGSLLLTGNSGGQGGGLNIQHNSSMDITGTMLLANNSADQGGGILVDTSRMTASGSVSFTNNSASTAGGGAFLASSYVTLGNTLSTADNADTQDGGTTVPASVLFTNNSAAYGGGVAARGFSNITLVNALLIANNAGVQGGGINFQEGHLFTTGTVSFINNSAGEVGGGGIAISVGSATLAGNVSFTGNKAIVQGGGIGLESSNLSLTGNVVLTGNHAPQGGGIDMGRSSVHIPGTVLLTNNSAYQGGGISLTTGLLNISGSIVLTSNHVDSSGGGMAFDDGSQMAITGNVYFIGNTAITGSGGAIYITDVSPLLYCASVVVVKYAVQDCFFQVDTNTSDKLLVFEGNMAESGSVLYGGSIDRCTLEGDPEANSGEVFDRIANYSEQVDTMSVISSDPFRACLCDRGQVCTAINDITSYPGQSFPVRVAAVGQRNGTHPAMVNAITNPSKKSHLDAIQYYQQVTNCTELNYAMFSTGTYYLQLELYVDGLCSSLNKNRLFVPVHLLPCPHAFELSESTQGCICEERLRKFTNSCDINDQTIERDGDFWVGYDNQPSGLILHPHCPFDYCKAKSIRFTLNDTDLQCKGDRSGLLCGACHPNRSLALGSSQCLSCSDAYLSLLVPFAVMGVVLVIFLLACRLTVALGTLSGLVFYANIVQANRSVFLDPPGSSNPLTVFIAWVNLDLGIETCFYDGMDAYAKTWLQFAFPIYIWGVIGIIMFISSRSVTISRILGKNPVEVLATLFLLSYVKILRTIITALSLTTLHYPNESQVVWLNDANIRYLEGKHIPLFVVGLLVFVLLFLPYTLLLLFGQWLLVGSNKKILFWMNNTKLKAFFDSYHSPYEEKHRYWTGLLLVVRFVLLLVFGTNVFGEESENLLAISAASFGLLAWLWMIGTVYKNWYLGALEASFVLNLGISAAATSYVQHAGGNQAVVAYMSTGIAFATFIAILLYHIDLQIKIFQHLKTFCCRRGEDNGRVPVPDDAGGMALGDPADPDYGSDEFREPLLDDSNILD